MFQISDFNDFLSSTGHPEECAIEFRRQSFIKEITSDISLDAMHIATSIAYIGKALSLTKNNDSWNKYGADLNTWQFIALVSNDIELRKISLSDAINGTPKSEYINILEYFRKTISFRNAYETILASVNINNSNNHTFYGISELASISEHLFKRKIIRTKQLTLNNIIDFSYYKNIKDKN